jgi:hypothetical protein
VLQYTLDKDLSLVVAEHLLMVVQLVQVPVQVHMVDTSFDFD